MTTYSGESTPCFDLFIPCEHWVGQLLGHGNGLDVEQWIGARCQCIAMNKNCMHKKLLYLVSKAIHFTKASFFLPYTPQILRDILDYLLALPCAKSAVNTLNLPPNLAKALVVAFVLCDRGFSVLREPVIENQTHAFSQDIQPNF